MFISKNKIRYNNLIENLILKEPVSVNNTYKKKFTKIQTKDELKEETVIIKNLLEENKIIFFIGSAISLFSPSDLPTGSTMRNFMLNTIIEKIPNDLKNVKEYVKELIDQDINPEVLYGSIYHIIGNRFFVSHSNLKKRNNEPVPFNSNHELLAKILIRENYPKILVTTNFDTLIENALKKLGKRINTDFFVYSDEEGFKNYLENHDHTKIAILKIHGTINKEESMIAVFQKTSVGLNFYQSKIISDIFNKYHVCFIGYSGNDVDLFQKYLSLNKDDFKGIYWNIRELKEINKKLERICCEYESNIKLIVGDMTDFFRILSKDIRIDYKQPSVNHLNIDITNDAFVEKIQIYEAILISGVLCLNSEKINLGKMCYEKAIELLERNNDSKYLEEKARAYAQLGMIYNVKRDYGKAAEKLNNAYLIYERINSKKGKNEVLVSFANTYMNQGYFENAIYWIKKTIIISLKDFNKSDVKQKIKKTISEGCYINNYFLLGNIYNKLKKYSKAEYFYLVALNMILNVENIYSPGLANAFNNLAVVYQKRRKFLKALGCFEKALEIYKQLGNVSGISAIYNNIASLEFERNSNKANKNSKELFEKSFVWAQKVMDITQMAKIADSYDAGYELDLAKKYYLRINEIIVSNELSNYSKLMYSYDTMGGFHHLQYDIDSSILEKVILSGNKQYLAAFCYNKVGEIVGNQGKIDEAQKYFNQAMELLSKNIKEECSELMIEIYKNLIKVLYSKGKFNEAELLQKFYLEPLHYVVENRHNIQGI